MDDVTKGPLILAAHAATVGAIAVRRALPQRQHRTVGAWCFADHLGPAAVARDRGLDIGPHPHIGLQTVTWLTTGEALHRDSLGSEQLIRPGQLNLMTAGRGVAHAEEATGQYAGRLEGIQLWVAQPDTTRQGPAAFEHHGSLPRIETSAYDATVLVGDFGGTSSPARHDTPLLGLELVVREPTTLPLRWDFEHAPIVLDGAIREGETTLVPGQIGIWELGRDEFAITPDGTTRVMMLGGVPFPETIIMWWNFVARTRDEISVAARSWRARDGRFAKVASALPVIEAPNVPWR